MIAFLVLLGLVYPGVLFPVLGILVLLAAHIS